MPTYRRGRPFKKTFYEIYDIPPKPGEYRLKEVGTGNHYYIGETNNLRRRLLEHKKSGKFTEEYYVEYMLAVEESSSKERRSHEQRSIARHSPSANRSRGGEGRFARDRVTEIEPPIEEVVESKPMNKITVSFRRLLSIIWRLFLVVALAFSSFAIIYYKLDNRLLVLPVAIILFVGARFILRKFDYIFLIRKS